MADSEHSGMGRRAFLGGVGVAAVGSAIPAPALAQAAGGLVPAIGSPAENINAMRTVWQSRMGLELPGDVLASLSTAENRRVTKEIGQKHGYSWEAIRNFSDCVWRLEMALEPEESWRQTRWRVHHDSDLHRFTASLLIVESLSKDEAFMNACRQACIEMKAIDEEMAASDLPSMIKRKPATLWEPGHSLEALIKKARTHMDEQLEATNELNEEFPYHLWKRTVREDSPHPPVSKALALQSGVCTLLTSPSDYAGLYITCPDGTVGSLHIRPSVDDSRSDISMEDRFEQKDLAERQMDKEALRAARLYFTRHPVDLETLDWGTKVSMAHELNIYEYNGPNGPDGIHAAITASDPVLYKTRGITPKKREALASSMEWGSTLISQAMNLADLLARLQLPEPMAAERKMPGGTMTPGRMLALEHVRDLKPNGVTIDNDTGRIIIDDEALAQEVDARSEVLREEQQGERIMAHAERAEQPLAR